MKRQNKMTAKKTNKEDLQFKIDELLLDLQRTRADFENYRKRVEAEKESARTVGKTQAILKLLPVIDNIERALTHQPKELEDNVWAQGVAGLAKHLDKSLESLGLQRIDAKAGTPFNPELHEAIQMDEDGEGEHEVVAQELQAGYKLDNYVFRPAMVKVTRK